ncbi:peptidoglycan DD-metalloendopeptidase family protein, partial [Desulfobacterales bacterium HSG2]|nr:peptidoglycan DD-metalloendopeptidase family protein [Desulfobacterales bacterium HSG2]
STYTGSGTYTQQAQYGSIRTTISPSKAVSAGAQWRVDGGSWQNSGRIVNNLSVGSHTVSFRSVSGWNAPSSQGVTVRANSTYTGSGTYTQQAQYGSVRTTISPSEAVSAGAQWRVDGGSWQNSGRTVNSLSVGNHTVSFRTVSGWNAPRSQSVSVLANSTYAGSGTYQQIPTDGYHSYFEEACQEYDIPCNLLKAVAHVESGWNQASHNGNDWGVMQINESGLLNIAQRLKNDYPGDYGSMTDQSVVALLKENSHTGARANIRGGASKLRWDADHVSGLIYDGEPQEALEVWWFVLAYYNGGGADGSLNTSNYPYRVYNCFLSGVTDLDDGERVPQIPITLPPHFSFRKATGAELTNGEVNSADRNLIPQTPEGFIRRTEKFNACTEMGHLHDNDGNELDIPGCVPDEFVLECPLEDYTAYNAPLNSVFDYSRPDYSEDNYVIDYLGEVGEKRFGYTLGGYKQEDGGSFIANGNYTAAGYGSQYLFYDGHKGIDFRTKSTEHPSGSGMKILATASGTFRTTGDTWNTAYIDHDNGYRTYYLHCKRNFEATNGSHVDAGDLIGYSGSEGTDGAHLHIDIRKGSGSSWFPIDPYGWQADEPYSWTRAVNAELWAGGIGGDRNGEPQNLVATEINSDGETNLSWDAPADTTPDNYNIYRNDVLVKTVTGDQLTHTDSGLEAGTEYCYHVTALIGEQESDPSNEVCPSSGATSEDHFTKVWEHNPLNRMQFWVVSATVNGKSLVAGDEIGVFDGEKCVGFAKVEGEITMDNFLNIITSQAYENGNGFMGGNEISFRIWDASEKAEIENSDIRASFLDIYTANDIPPPKFESSADYGVKLDVTVESEPVVSHKILLKKGYNIISSYITPSNPNMLKVFKPLMDNNTLKTALDEDNASVVPLFGGSWTYNGDDDFSNEEGYKVWVKEDTELPIEGTMVELPIDISLTDGFNFMGYPVASPQASERVFQTLMDADSRFKAYDEDNGTILKVFGTWSDSIEKLMPGEGYVVQVSDDTSVRIDQSGAERSARSAVRSVSRKKKRDDRLPVHFTPAWEGNPYNRMNFWIVGVDDFGIETGDEIGVFDGEKCVGVGVVDGEISSQKILTITTSQDDGDGNGFTEGREVSFRFWNSGEGIETDDVAPLFLELSDGGASDPPVFEKYGDYGVILRMGYTLNDFPVSVPKDISSVIDVLAIDNTDENELTITDVSEPVHGVTVVNTDDNTITYTPDDGYIGADIFSYTVTNGTETAHATVKVVVSESDNATDDDDTGDDDDDDDDHIELLPGVFVVNDLGQITIDWLYDGGAYKGELGLFSLRGLDLTVPDLTAFIEEAVSRVLSDSETGYIVLSDKTERARESGTLSGESADWNEGDYNHAKTFAMRPGDRFALVLVPNGTFEALSKNPGTASTHLRPLFSFTSPNADYGMHTGQVADVNGHGLGFVFEDMEFTNSDRDYNDLIIQISGAVSDVPTIDAMIEVAKAGRSKRARRDWYDWRVSDELGRKIIRHLEALPTEDDQWMSVSFDGSAELRIYDAEDHCTGTLGADIPGSLRFTENGELVVNLPALRSGVEDYRIVLHAAEDETADLTVSGRLGQAEISSDTKPVEIEAHQVLRSDLSASPDDGLTNGFTAPGIPEASDGTPLVYDFDGDGNIDDDDIREVTSRWNICEGDPEWNPAFDMDDDGCITILDIMAVSNSRYVP